MSAAGRVIDSDTVPIIATVVGSAFALAGLRILR